MVVIDPRRLEALVAVHRTGSVSAAADELHYGQPTISHHLKRLEAETGSVLVQRVGRGIRLTDDGRRLARRGEEILGLLHRAGEELDAATSLRSGRVRVAAFPSAAATMVPGAIALLAQRAPDLRLELVEAEPPEAVGLLRAGQADLALTFGYGEDDRERDGVTSEVLFTDPLHLVLGASTTPTPASAAPSAAPTASGDEIADHRDSRWVTGCERCRGELVALCAEAGFEPDIAFASDDYVAVQALVAAGLGVTLLPGLALRAHRHAAVRTVPLPGVERTVRLASYGLPPRPASVEVVAEALRRAGAQTVSGRRETELGAQR